MSNDTTTAEAQARQRAHEVLKDILPTCVGTVADGPNKGAPYHTSLCRSVAALILTYERTLAEVRRERERVDGALQGMAASHVARREERDRLTASLASMTVERDEAVVKLCGNTPCPVCGGGPSGEWSEGDEVDCDGCGTALYVDSVAPCQGVTKFSLADARCIPCKGRGWIGDESDVSRAPDCAKCRGAGRCEPTLAEAKAAAGIETPKESK